MRVIRTFARSQRERIHEQRCIHIQQRFIQYIRLMTGSPFNSYKSYRVLVIESIDLNILIVNRNTMILDSMPKTICLKRENLSLCIKNRRSRISYGIGWLNPRFCATIFTGDEYDF